MVMKVKSGVAEQDIGFSIALSQFFDLLILANDLTMWVFSLVLQSISRSQGRKESRLCPQW
jgi:hypothetical protein